jgi:hypothetical protein
MFRPPKLTKIRPFVATAAPSLWLLFLEDLKGHKALSARGKALFSEIPARAIQSAQS